MFSQTVMVTWPRWPPCRYMVKTLKIVFSRTEQPMILKIGMQHRVLEYYQIPSNDESRLTVDVNFVSLCICMEKCINGGLLRNY